MSKIQTKTDKVIGILIFVPISLFLFNCAHGMYIHNQGQVLKNREIAQKLELNAWCANHITSTSTRDAITCFIQDDKN